MITHGNLFSGSGTWELAAQICGIKTLWEAEIEPFPVAVEAKRFPDAIQLGDVSKISGADIPVVDIMTNSSPCQDLSVAGKRAGLDGERSGLFDQAIRICKEMRDAQRRLHSGWTDVDLRLLRPRFWCWENVPGAFSSNNGEDFRIVIESVARMVEEDAVIPVPPKGWSYTGVVDLEGGRLPGAQWTLNSMESPRDAEESFLSQILEDTVPEKYFLSERACLGILRRSLKRGKTLPKVLLTALKRQAGLLEEKYEELKKEWSK